VINQDKMGHVNGNMDLSELESRSSYFGWKNCFEDHNKVLFSVKLKGADELLIGKLGVIGNDLDIKFSGRVGNGKNAITIYGEKINLSDILL
jgi:hypothetical protein